MLRNFLLATIILLLGGGILYITITKLDPFGEQALVAYSAFFIALFATVMALFTFVFFFLAELQSGHKQSTPTFHLALRRGTLVGICVVSLAILQLFRFLGLLEAILLCTFLALVEWIFVMAGK